MKTMTDREDIPATVVDDALEKAKSIEDGLANLRHELANLALIKGPLDDAATDKIKQVRGVLANLAILNSTSINEINQLLVREGVTDLPAEQVIPRKRSSTIVGEWPRDREKPHGWNSEMSDLRARLREGQFYEGIIDPAIVPIPNIAEGEEAVVITIVSDNKVRINGKDIILGNEHLFIFNTYMYLREFEMSGPQMKEFGFKSEGLLQPQQKFSNGLQDVRAAVSQAAGFAAIKRTGHGIGTRYTVSDRLVLIDGRLDAKSALKENPTNQSASVLQNEQPNVDTDTSNTDPVEENVPLPDLEKTNEQVGVSDHETRLEIENSFIKSEWFENNPPFELAPDALKFEGSALVSDVRLRRNIINRISMAYKEHPALSRAKKSLVERMEALSSEVTSESSEEHNNKISAQSVISPEQERELFKCIARGVETYSDLAPSFDEISDAANDILLRSAIANRLLFRANVHLVDTIAESNYSPHGPTLTELVSAASIGLTRAICRSALPEPKYTFKDWAPHFIQRTVSAYLDGHLHIRHPSGKFVNRDEWFALEEGAEASPLDQGNSDSGHPATNDTSQDVDRKYDTDGAGESQTIPPQPDTESSLDKKKTVTQPQSQADLDAKIRRALGSTPKMPRSHTPNSSPKMGGTRHNRH